ncbi:MAG TPA: T9SS type A sorting domain-containing protein [Bacteroidales bacterium]|nr:T9SS type A sorting domain-containing protein [Bacteroidales bacterium]
MKISYLIHTCLVFISFNTFSQSVFQKVTGIGLPGNATSFCISADSTFVTACSGSLVKTDTNGNVIWAKRNLMPAMYKKSNVISQANGGYMVLYDMIANGYGSSDIMIFNTDSDGLIEWIRYYGTDYTDIPTDIVEAPNGDFLVTGQTNSISHNDKDILLMRINKTGDQFWQRTYGTDSEEDRAEKSIQFSFGGFVLAGKISSGISMLRTDEDGRLKWCKTYESGTLYDIVENPVNGDLFACGVIMPNMRGENNIFVMLADSSGNVIWAKIIGNNHNEIAYSISGNPDFSQVYISGEFQADSSSASDAFAACLNAGDGSIVWAKLYSSIQKDIFYDNAVYNSNSIINVGVSDCGDTAYRNIYMVKTAMDGISGCNEYDLVPVIDSNLILVPQVITLATDSGELWVTSTCYPPSLVSAQQLALCTTESVEESAGNGFSIYPNPAQDNFTVESPFSDNEAIELFNEMGSKIDCPFTTNGIETTFSTAGLPRGVYLIRISGQQKSYARKFILN